MKSKTPSEVQIETVKNMIARLIPDHKHEFNISIENGRPGEENGFFQVRFQQLSKSLT